MRSILESWISEDSLDTVSGARKKVQIQQFALVSLIVLSLATRIYYLNAGLWLDEILTYVNYARLPFREIVTTFDSENQHFLYSILAHTSFIIFGESAWALRLPAVLFGVGSIWALYLLGSEVANRREGFLAAALLAFSYHHVWFSQNARGYSGLLFWTILSSWLFIRALRGHQRRVWIYYAITIALGVYTHLTMVFVLAGQSIIYLFILLIHRKREWSQLSSGIVFGIGLAGILSLLLYAPVIPQVLNTIGGTEQSVVTEWKNPIWTVLELMSGLKISFAGGVLAAGALLLFGIGFVSYARTEPILPGLLVLPPFIGATVTLAIGHHLWPRFFFFAFGLGALVVIRGATVLGIFLVSQIERVFTLPANSRSWGGIALPVGLILVSALSVPLAYGPKQDYGGALNFLNNNLMPGDSVVTVFLTEFVYQDFYKTDWEAVDSFEELNAIRDRSNRTWLIYTFPPVIEAIHPELMTSIQREFNLVEQFGGTVSNGTVYVVRAD
jgi:4-amino-4-deoxy-L-arabinose transferase-like glycosyltransferase